MVDDPKNRGPQDRQRINLSQAHEVAYWTQKFGISEATLRDVVKVAGDRVENVAGHLRVKAS